MLLTAAAVAACQAMDGHAALLGGDVPAVIDAGSVSDYSADGVYAKFRDRGFFVVRQGSKLFVLSAFCTHQKTKLDPKSDGSFYCKRHGSTFDPAGKVTEGPAKRDLSVLQSSTDQNGHLLVTILPT